MGVISWLVDYLLYEEGAASGEEEQRLRQAEATHEELDEDEEEGSDEQVWPVTDNLVNGVVVFFFSLSLLVFIIQFIVLTVIEQQLHCAFLW